MRTPFFFFDARYPHAFKRLRGRKVHILADCLMKEQCFNASLSSPILLSLIPLPLQVYVDAAHQVGHALHLRMFLWFEQLLPQTEEEEEK